MGLVLLAITNGIVSALLYPTALYLNLVLPSLFFGYASYYAVGATNKTLKYAVAGNIYGAVLAYGLIKLLPVLGGGTMAWMILFFVIVVLFVLAVQFDLLSKAYCSFLGAVCYFTTFLLAPSTWTATPEYVLLMAVLSLIIGWAAGFITVNVPALFQPKDKSSAKSNANSNI